MPVCPQVPDILYVISLTFPTSFCPIILPIQTPFHARFMTTLLTKTNAIPVPAGLCLLSLAPEEAALHIAGPRVLGEGEQGLGDVIRPGHLLPPGLL